MIPLNIRCTHCGENLMDATRKLDGRPSVRLTIAHGDKQGLVHVSALYGSPVVETDLDVPSGTVIELRCPHCGEGFDVTRRCGRCSAPMVNLGIQEAGEIVVCTRMGCKNHLIEFADISGSFRDFYDGYSPFFAKRPPDDPDSEPKDL